MSVEWNELDRKQAPIVGIVACMNVKIKMQYCCTMVAWECRGSCLAAVACKLGYLKLKAIGDAVILSATVLTATVKVTCICCE